MLVYYLFFGYLFGINFNFKNTDRRCMGNKNKVNQGILKISPLKLSSLGKSFLLFLIYYF